MVDKTSSNTPSQRRNDERYVQLRTLAARAYQLRASTRGAEHFLRQPGDADRDTGTWLIVCALNQANELASDIDTLARALKEGPAEPALVSAVPRIRSRAHQLQAASRAADHFLEQDSRDDHDTGGWLVATALQIADQVASDLDDLASTLKRSANDAVIDADQAALTRRVSAATAI